MANGSLSDYQTKVSATQKVIPNDFIDILMFNVSAGRAGAVLGADQNG